MNIATCVGCSCDDNHACRGGCAWLRVDREHGIGICSNCPELVAEWDAEEQGFGLVLPNTPEFDETVHALRSR